MIPILYSNVEEALGGTWTEKKGTFQKNYYWNCETDTAVLTAYTGSYTAYAAIAVTPGKLYHIHAVRGTSSKSRVLLFVKSDYTILWKLEASSSPVDRDVIAPANAAYALITAGTKNDTYLNNTEFKEFSTGGPVTNGLGRISDCISCLVTEERNGKYEAEFTYPVSGIHYEDIQKGRVISVTHDETGTRQPFVIYRASAPINGMVTYNAHHASYALSNAIVQPFTATSVADAFDQLVTKCMTINPFIFWTDNVTAGTMTSKVPASVRSLLGGTRGSILDVFGGEYEFDGYTVKNHASRGSDKGVTIRYGKNLTDIEDTSDISETYNAVVPYWSDGQDTVVFGGIITAAGAEVVKAIALDLSGEWEEAPTVSDLEARAATYLSNNTPWIQKQNIKIDFVALWQTEEYKNIAPLERVALCDTVHVIHPDLDINVTAKVIKTTWDVLADRYDSIELGEAKSSFADTILDGTKDALSTTLRQYAKTSAMTEAIDHATQLITGGLGGHIVFMYDADGLPTDMLVMDTDDVTTAVNVLRINVNGIGFSDSGINGPYDSAWTLDGQFVADFITAGHLSCNRIQGGTLSLGGSNNGNGVLVMYDANGAEIGRWNNTGITMNKGRLTSADGKVYLDLTNNELACTTLLGDLVNIKTGDHPNFNPTYGGYVNFIDSRQSSYEAYGLRIYPGTGVNGEGSAIKAPLGVTIAELSTAYGFYAHSTGCRMGKGVENYISCTSSGISIGAPGNVNVVSGDVEIRGSLTVRTNKNRLIETENYGERLLYCYETASPLFGDVGEGKISEDGYCYIPIDPVLAATINTAQYQVFLQRYGSGDCYISERAAGYFIVSGTPGLEFGWEIKAKQKDSTNKRLDNPIRFTTHSDVDYGRNGSDYYLDLIQRRIGA